MGMNDFNPYQTPASDEPAQGCWRRGGKVWLAAGSALPCRCIRCAGETTAEEGKNVNLYWTPPAALLLSAAVMVLFFIFAPVLFAWLDEWKAPVLIVLALLFTAAQIWLQRKRRLFVPVCRRCRRRRIGVMAALALAAVLLLLLAESKIPLLMSLGFGGAMIALLALMLYGNRRIRALAIRDDCSVLTGFGRRFLDTLENRG